VRPKPPADDLAKPAETVELFSAASEELPTVEEAGGLDSAPPDEIATLEEAAGLLSVGVVVVTVSVDGHAWGQTTGSCTSLTATPPQVLLSLKTRTVACTQILERHEFGISIPSAGQVLVAQLGASRSSAKFIDEHCDTPSDPPRIRGALHHLDCRLAAEHEHGDQTIIVGDVIRIIDGDGVTPDPLIHFDRGFHRVGGRIRP
jgi:flavin reductase (DIM6/NTAB) family NADH-FMN oxidoreductase RutF